MTRLPHTDRPSVTAAAQRHRGRAPGGWRLVLLRAGQTRLLLKPLAAAIPWWPLLAATVLAALIVLPVLVRDPAPDAPPHQGLLGLRFAAVLLGAGASFALADRMAPTVMAPTPRWLRQWLRSALVIVPMVACWWLLYAAVRTVRGADAAAPVPELFVEAAACMVVGLAGAAVAARSWHTSTAAVAGSATQGLLIAGSLFLQDAQSPWVDPTVSTWAQVHRYWALLLGCGLVVLLLANRDTWPLLRRRARR